MNAGFSIPATRDLVQDGPELRGVGARPGAVDDRVRRAEHAEQRAPAATVLVGALDQARDLDQLDQHAADPRERGNRAQGRERVVAGPDLDLGQRLEDRRLADVGRADERDLGRPLAADGDRVAVHGGRSRPRLLDLRQQRLAEVRVRTVLVVGQLGEQRVDLADAFPAFLADQPALGHLCERAVRHGHRPSPSTPREARPREPRADGAAGPASDPAPSSDAG